nr:isoform 6 of protein polybromo-1 [Quercus suber]
MLRHLSAPRNRSLVYAWDEVSIVIRLGATAQAVPNTSGSDYCSIARAMSKQEDQVSILSGITVTSRDQSLWGTVSCSTPLSSYPANALGVLGKSRVNISTLSLVIDQILNSTLCSFLLACQRCGIVLWHMDSARKRKASNATPSTLERSASKKLKLLEVDESGRAGCGDEDERAGIFYLTHTTALPSAAAEQVSARVDHRQQPCDRIRKSTDTSLSLLAYRAQNKHRPGDLPDYYAFTKLPIAVDTIKQKVQNNAYPTLTTLESDLKRLVQNAKDYNAPKSDIYEDAERIRKLVYNFMKVHNPAYRQDPNYVSFPTAIPEVNGHAHTNGTQDDHQTDDVPEAAGTDSSELVAPLKSSEPPSERKESVAPSATTGDDDGGDGSETDFTGKTFQQAQQLLITELLKYTDAEGLEIYTPFANLPSRKLLDYYKVIRHPVCIKGLGKRARGQHGHAPPTDVSDFKTWAAFEEEASFIWRNAKAYNEDDAKEKVEEPSRPSIKLGGPKPKVTLNLAQHRPSPSPSVSVDSEALARQQRLVQAGSNGTTTVAVANNDSTNPSSRIPSLEPRPQSSAPTGSPTAPQIKSESVSTPALANAAPTSISNGMMPPPLVRPSSGSPLPSQMPVHSYSSYTFAAPVAIPSLAVRAYPLEQALLPVVTLATHPQLKAANPLMISLPAHPTLTHQSSTITVTSTHFFLQISPTISKQLSMGRPYKMFVTVNGSRLTQRDTQFSAETGRRTHMYEGSLAQGVNRIEIEVAAAKEGDGKGLDVEKLTVYANLMK